MQQQKKHKKVDGHFSRLKPKVGEDRRASMNHYHRFNQYINKNGGEMGSGFSFPMTSTKVRRS
jgi:hypothetical protein